MKLIVILFILTATLFAAIPQQINYQGYLTSPSGSPLDTTVDITFNLYTSLTGFLIWTEVHPSVVVSGGLFNVSLGSITPITDINFLQMSGNGGALGIEVGNNTEMTPRIALSSVFYSHRVGSVMGATGGSIYGSVSISEGSLDVGVDHAINIPTAAYYSLTGGSDNSIDSSYSHVGGGTDNRALGSFSVIGGGASNRTAKLSFVGGGNDNQALGLNSFVGGGKFNYARGIKSFVGGGGGDTQVDSNSARGNSAFIGAGRQNNSSGDYAVVAGGYGNSSSGSGSTVGGGFTNSATGGQATIAGGVQNQASVGNSFIGGGQGNIVSGAGSGAIGGGVSNQVTAGGGFVGGGVHNSATADYAFIGGGLDNQATEDWSTVAGGDSNRALAPYSFIGGGSKNRVRSGSYTTIGGGFDNDVYQSDYAFIGGGQGNFTGGDWSTIAGGLDNFTLDYSAIGGGYSNYVNVRAGTIAGGWNNIISPTGADSADYGSIGGGYSNSMSGAHLSTICGGENNSVTGYVAVIGGGRANDVSGYGSCIPGGTNNSISGANSFVCGQSVDASANHSFAFGDGSELFSPGSNNTASFLTTGGFRIWTDNPVSSNIGTRLAAGGSSWIALSDSAMKTNRMRVNTAEVLQKVLDLPMDQWNYKHQADGPLHIGPMAQDLWTAFHLGEDSLGIETIDADGVLFAAVQELAKENNKLQISNIKLEEEMRELRALVQSLIADKKQTLNRK